jgi:hypothetical protein
MSVFRRHRYRHGNIETLKRIAVAGAVGPGRTNGVDAGSAGGDGRTATAGGDGRTATAGGDGRTATAGGDGRTATAGGIGRTATAGGDGRTATAGGDGRTATAGGDERTATDGPPGELRKGLSLAHTAVRAKGLSRPAALVGLRTLSLAYSKVTDARMVHVKRLSNLQVLRLDGTPSTDAGLQDLYGLKHLLEVSLETSTKARGAYKDSLSWPLHPGLDPPPPGTADELSLALCHTDCINRS